jgi:hypothetical protein
MRLASRDRLATIFVWVAALTYLLWLAGVGPQDEAGVRGVTAIVLALGVAASASAVVPGFEGLWHGSKTYLGVTSLIGLGAFVAAVVALVDADELMLGLLVSATVVLWVISTVRHSAAVGTEPRAAGGPRPTAAPGRP